MLFGQLECFLAVARLGNLSRATEEMFDATDADGAAEGFGGGGWRPALREDEPRDAAHGGREGVPAIRRALGGELRGGQAATGGATGASGGRLVLGASPGVGTYALPGLLERFTAAYPRVSVSVRTGHSEDILVMVLREEVQLGLTRAMRHPEVESLQLYEDEMAGRGPGAPLHSEGGS